jgi:hypothetical protein
MKRLDILLPVVMLGSLWGMTEILPLPVSVMIAAGVLFLTIGRRLVNLPGSSLAIGLVVCLFKTYAVQFHYCTWGGILSVAISFDILSSVVWKDSPIALRSAVVRGALTCVAAFFVFVAAMHLLRHPYWVAGGWEKIFDYAWRDSLPATGLSLVAAPLGVLLGNTLWNLKQSPRRALPALYACAIALPWLVATIRFFERIS